MGYVGASESGFDRLAQGSAGRRHRIVSGLRSGTEQRAHRTVDICKTVGADTNLSGVDGRKYMNLEPFAQAGVDLVFQDYDHPVYLQLFAGFESHLSALDLVLNCGPESLKVLRAGRQ